MRRRGLSAVRWLISLVIIVAIALGLFVYRRGQASDTIKAQALGIVEGLALRPAWREKTRGYVEQAHEKAFSAALDAGGGYGQRFDGDAYLQVLFDQVIAWTREDGEARLADLLSDNRATFSLEVRER